MQNITLKSLWLIALSVFFPGWSFSQFDEKFYFPSKEWIAIEHLEYEEVNLPKDSVTLTGLFMKPDNHVLATIFFFHGGGGNNSTYIDMVRPLVKSGFQVFMIDFRGYGKSTGSPTHLNIATDGQYVLDYLLNRPDVRYTKLILYGASMGTLVATKLAKENQTKIHGLVLDGAISSFSDLAADYSPEVQREFIRKMVPSPYAAAEDIKDIQTLPTLFICSLTDKEVPYAQSEKVFQNANEPKNMFVYEGEHLDALLRFPNEVIGRIKNMIPDR